MNRPVPVAQGQLHQRGMDRVMRNQTAKKEMNSMQVCIVTTCLGEWHRRKIKHTSRRGPPRRYLKPWCPSAEE